MTRHTHIITLLFSASASAAARQEKTAAQRTDFPTRSSRGTAFDGEAASWLGSSGDARSFGKEETFQGIDFIGKATSQAGSWKNTGPFGDSASKFEGLTGFGTLSTCTYVDEADQQRTALSCENKQCCTFDEYKEAGKEDIDSCLNHCSCTYTEERTTTETHEYPVKIRGVPVFSQFDAGDGVLYKPIGCAAVALVELAMYYGSWGWSGLLENSGPTNWVDKAYDAADFLRTWIRMNQSPTLMSTVKDGIQDYFADAGYSAAVNYLEVTDDVDEMDEAWGRIKQSINQGHPVYIGFDANGESEGGGIGGGGDNFGFIDHYGLIVGYDDTGTNRKIHINMGWGYFEWSEHCDGDSCITLEEGVAAYDWEVGKGKVFLWFVKMNAAEKTVADEQCPLNSFYSYYEPDYVYDKDNSERYIGASFAYYDTTPTLKALIAGSDCALLGGTQTGATTTYDYTWTDIEVDCDAKYKLYDNWLDDDYIPEGFEGFGKTVQDPYIPGF